jgi:hypothetical protein
MRYTLVPTLSFTDANGVSRPVKDLREIPAYDVSNSIDVTSEVSCDEVASRRSVYGEGGEGLAYKIWEANIVALVDLGFDVAAIRRVGIPP